MLYFQCNLILQLSKVINFKINLIFVYNKTDQFFSTIFSLSFLNSLKVFFDLNSSCKNSLVWLSFVLEFLPKLFQTLEQKPPSKITIPDKQIPFLLKIILIKNKILFSLSLSLFTYFLSKPLTIMFGMDGLTEIFEGFLTIFFFKPIGCFLTAPAYRIQSLLQTQTLIPNLPTTYKSAFHCLESIVKQEGFGSLWRGTSAGIWKILPEAFWVYFFRNLYEGANLIPSFNEFQDYKKFCAGNIAMGGAVGATTQLILYPLDMIRLRLATDVVKPGVDVRRFLGIKDCWHKLWNLKDGIFGVYEGCGVSIFCNVLYRGLMFGIYDSGKPFLPDIEEFDWTHREEYNKKRLWLAMASSLLAHFAVYPFDTIRKRMAMQTGGDKIIYQSAFDCARKCIKQEGLRGLYRGSVFSLGNCAFGGWFMYKMDFRNPVDRAATKFVWF